MTTVPDLRPVVEATAALTDNEIQAELLQVQKAILQELRRQRLRDKIAWTLSEVAKATGLSENTIRREIEDNGFPGSKVVRSRRCWIPREVIEWLESQETAAQ